MRAEAAVTDESVNRHACPSYGHEPCSTCDHPRVEATLTLAGDVGIRIFEDGRQHDFKLTNAEALRLGRELLDMAEEARRG